LENGIHPTRLHLLLQLIEQTVSQGEIQVVGTTHSPHFLGLLRSPALEFASVTYRLEDQPDTRIQRILDIPHAREVIEKYSLEELFPGGRLENNVAFMQDEEVVG
ncbi:MAG: ATP-binding protein, partial [Chloroflexi bacterium]|nr:ATP-binding protein [Chloroflexota bacterium]